MTDAALLRTPRLLLRDWREDDRDPFADLNADPAVMEHFPDLPTRQRSDAMIDRIRHHLAEHGFGLWAVELAATGQFIGFTGLRWATFDAHFTPAVEIGWRLAHHAWGRGYATEAARAAADYGFDHCGINEIVSFTTRRNERSQAVMRRLGMTRDNEGDFDHPAIPQGHPLAPHVLYRLDATRR